MPKPLAIVSYLFVAQCLGCATPPRSATAEAPVVASTEPGAESPLVASLNPATDGRPQMLGRPWLRQRAALTLHNADATLTLDSEAGVSHVRCPEELVGTSTQGCASPAEARALEQRVDRTHEAWRGQAVTHGGEVHLSLRPSQGALDLTLHCRWVEAGALACAQVSGWPVREGFQTPEAVTFARAH